MLDDIVVNARFQDFSLVLMEIVYSSAAAAMRCYSMFNYPTESEA